MKVYFHLLGATILTLGFVVSSPSLAKKIRFPNELTVKYFPYNASVEEFKKGKTRVETIIKKIADEGLVSHWSFDIGIGPKPRDKYYDHKYYNIKWVDNNLHIYLSAPEEEIEVALLHFYLIYSPLTDSPVYHPSGVNLAEFLKLTDRMEKIMGKFRENELVVEFPESYEIHFSKSRDFPRRGKKTISTSENSAAIDTSVTDDELERFISNFVK